MNFWDLDLSRALYHIRIVYFENFLIRDVNVSNLLQLRIQVVIEGPIQVLLNWLVKVALRELLPEHQNLHLRIVVEEVIDFSLR